VLGFRVKGLGFRAKGFGGEQQVCWVGEQGNALLITPPMLIFPALHVDLSRPASAVNLSLSANIVLSVNPSCPALLDCKSRDLSSGPLVSLILSHDIP